MNFPRILLAAVLALSACRHADTPAPPSEGETTREVTRGGIRFLEIFAHGADESSPLVVAIHGRGGSPERFARVWQGFPEKAEIALPQGFARTGDGWTWFELRGYSEDVIAAALASADDKLWPAIVELAAGRKIIVTGFSQGGILAYVLAARHADAIAYAFPVAGGAPDKLIPARGAPIYALHGTDDDVVPVTWARSAIAAFRRQGGTAELRAFPGIGHTVTPEIREDLWAHVRAAIVTEARQ
jgi:phospholipase/carboxylesterase